MQSSFTSPGTLICQLASLGIISIIGEDATSYLQGKVTNDVDQLNSTHAQLGCHCDFKGKTWNIFYALGGQQHIDLICHQQSLTDSLAELKKYGVFSKVDFSDSSSNYEILGLMGKEAETALLELVGSLPDNHLHVSKNQDLYVMRIDLPSPRYLVVANKQVAQVLLSALKQYEQPEDLWNSLDIVAGIANIQTATSAEFVPQMMNMHALGAISFEKGCYMGQEVVARTKYLGKNKRSAFVLVSPDTSSIEAGDTLEVKAGDNWRRSGTVLRSAIQDGKTWVLAVLPKDTELDAALRAKTNPNQEFALEPLPYDVE